MSRPGLACVVFAAAIGAAAAQHEGFEAADALAERIRNGGWFEPSKWRRGDDGALEVHYFADVGSAEKGRFVPLLGADLERGLANAGAIGFLSLCCHGPGDLLSMTDAGFHFAALGIDASDAGLRQLLGAQLPAFDGPRGRAELLDRLLAIDVLCRRSCKPAVAELGSLAAAAAAPPALRESASRAIAVLRGNPDPVARNRLAAETLRLPAGFDACVLVDHARLPELDWLTALGRRLGALVTASRIAGAGGTPGAAVKNGAQLMCDVVSELPFGVVHRYGNARIDHSCVVITAKPGQRFPFAFTWQAVGAFEHERWQDAAVPAALASNNPLLAGTLTVAADHVFASTDGGLGMPRPALVEKLKLLLDSGDAVRVVVPATSRLWAGLAFAKVPPAEGGELRLVCGEPAVLTAMVAARDELDAEAWVARGKELLAQAKAMLLAELPDAARECHELQDLLDAVFAATFCTKGDAAFATVEVRGMTPAKVRAIAEALAR
ncbi:MAG TPA: hypothetical protein VFZ65_09185 [Planctomycetota bacterium]|nr:hypothetical protein [Planctomycetota bacterium]